VSSDQLHAHLPWSRHQEFLPLLAELGLRAELALTGSDLDRFEGAPPLFPQQMRPPAPLTLHAPFNDLNPGSSDPRISEVTRTRLLQTLSVAARTGARLIVCHPGYEHWRYAGNIDLWLDASCAFWPSILQRAEQVGCSIALENVFDTDYIPLQRLLTRLDHPLLGHCFDVGHWHLFSQVPVTEWLDALAPYLLHLHLHDNHGSSDAHLPVGEGNIDFDALFSVPCLQSASPSMTLEAHHPEHLRRSCAAVRRLLDH